MTWTPISGKAQIRRSCQERCGQYCPKNPPPMDLPPKEMEPGESNLCIVSAWRGTNVQTRLQKVLALSYVGARDSRMGRSLFPMLSVLLTVMCLLPLPELAESAFWEASARPPRKKKTVGRSSPRHRGGRSDDLFHNLGYSLFQSLAMVLVVTHLFFCR